MTTLIKNIGSIVTGDVAAPTMTGSAVLIENGLITSVFESAPHDLEPKLVIDAAGMELCPGLIDSHAHPVVGEWHPRQQVQGWIGSTLHGGVTTIISAGAAHMPGRPADPVGVLSMAILTARIYENARPSGVKVLGGVLIPSQGLERDDFERAAANGVRIFGEVGYGDVDLRTAASLSELAREAGMRVIMHCGGGSHVGALVAAHSTTVSDIQMVQPDIVSHLNGGSTSIPLEDALFILHHTDYPFDLVTIGNPKVLVRILKDARKAGQLSRVMLGTDTPAGFGVVPLGMLRLVLEAASLAEIEPAVAWALASGNTARIHGLSQGTIRIGAPADVVLIDAPVGSAADSGLESLTLGDLPHIACVLVDGEVLASPSRNTPSGRRTIALSGEVPGSEP